MRRKDCLLDGVTGPKQLGQTLRIVPKVKCHPTRQTVELMLAYPNGICCDQR